MIEGGSDQFKSGFPDNNIEMQKSANRMPGHHIMMPNEGVFSNKTVIKNFPNKGDETNASFASKIRQNRYYRI